jgi:hypothetical protein
MNEVLQLIEVESNRREKNESTEDIQGNIDWKIWNPKK